MKNHAQSILQFTGYPLEPIVAQEVQKIYQTKLIVASLNTSPSFSSKPLPIEELIYSKENWDIAWFTNYE